MVTDFDAWHPDLKELAIKIKFAVDWAEGEYVKALQAVSVDMLARIYNEGGVNFTPTQTVKAIQCIYADMLEARMVKKVKMVLVDNKKYHKSLHQFYGFVATIFTCFPKIPFVPTTVVFEDKDKLYRIEKQMRGAATLAHLVLSHHKDYTDQYRPLWPSESRPALLRERRPW